MRLAGRRWRASVSTARLDGVDYRIVRPQRPAGHATLRESRFGAQLSLGKAAAVDVEVAWWLAARSPHSLVHLPLRSSATSCGEEYGGRKLDLVLLHHTLGFRQQARLRTRRRGGARLGRRGPGAARRGARNPLLRGNRPGAVESAPHPEPARRAARATLRSSWVTNPRGSPWADRGHNPAATGAR